MTHHHNHDHHNRNKAHTKRLIDNNWLFWGLMITNIILILFYLNSCYNLKQLILNPKREIQQRTNDNTENNELYGTAGTKTSAYKITIPSNYCNLTKPMTLNQMALRWHVSISELEELNPNLSDVPHNKPIQPDKENPIKVPENTNDLIEYEKQVLDLTNIERKKFGLVPLSNDTELSRVARIKSHDLSKNNYFSHNSPTYGSPFDMMKQFGIQYKSAGENIAKGQKTPSEVVNAWMQSTGHRANILNNGFTHIGIGYDSNGNLWTQMFISK